MKSIEINDIKKFTQALFVGDAFDKFKLMEASFDVLTGVKIDGHINDGFISDEERNQPEYREGLVSWGRIKQLCYDTIKGRKVPLKFKIVLKLPDSLVPGFISQRGVNFKAEECLGLYANFTFQNNALSCVTGIALKSFVLDKSLENSWDDFVAAYVGRCCGEK